MMKFNATLAAVALTVFTVSAMPSGPVRAQPSGIINDSEAYAVYASVVPTRFGTGEKPLAAVALLQETRAGMDCVGPEKDAKLQPEWRRVVQSYRKENARVRIIRSGFNLGVPYSIVTVAQLRQLMRDAGYSKQSPQSNALGSDVFARFPDGRLVAFSAVGFNAERTRAMVAKQFDCFPSWEPGTESAAECQQGRHFVLEKKDGRWNILHDVPVGCFWTA
jgi:hypothetical protein